MRWQGKGGISARSRLTRYIYSYWLATASGIAFLLLLSTHIGSVLLTMKDAPIQSGRSHIFDVQNSFTINTAGCTIPSLKPYDESIINLLISPRIAPCRQENFTLLRNNATHIWISRDDRASRVSDISCCYNSFYRPVSVKDITSFNADNRIEYGPCIHFSKYIQVLDEFVKVTCMYKSKRYEQFFLFAQKKPMTKRYLIEDINSQSKPEYNVIIMGLDGVSRLNFVRTMPETDAFLKAKGAIQLKGYNKVGHNTFPNLTPMLLGVRDVELHKLCWPHIEATFDGCPFVWELFKNAGYYTALAEDSSRLGTFNLNLQGFVGTPTDYYAHTFMYEAEQQVGNKLLSAFLCMGDKYFYQVLLEYIKRLTFTLSDQKLFGFFWEVSVSHDFLNGPLIMDSDYEKLLNDLDVTRYLEDTILILMSDHGFRWGKLRYTKQGRLEARLPLVYILLPLSFRKKYNLAYDNLRTNSKRLTTAFDIYATLTDIADMSSITNESIERRSGTAFGKNRGISLFLPVPGNRTCKMADIDEHWCTCYKGQKNGVDRWTTHEAAAFLVRHLNGLLREHPKCARLQLAEVLEATELMVGSPLDSKQGWREYTLVVRTEPGGGEFEATLRRSAADWTLAGTVSRLNLYGDQSHCVHHLRLKLYCYCR